VLAYSAPSCTVGHVTLNGDVVWQGSVCNNFPNPRGVNTLLIDSFGCSVEETRTFDTHISTNSATQLSNYLRQLNRGGVIVGVTADEATWRLSDAVSTLQQLGVDVSDVDFRGSFAFIAQKGYPSKTALRKVLTETESNKSPARLNAVITGRAHKIDAKALPIF